METFIIIIVVASIIGLITAYSIKTINRYKMQGPTDQLVQAKQALQVFQVEIKQLQKDKEDLLSRATHAEGANKLLLQEFEQYHLLQQEHLKIINQLAVLQTQLSSANEKLTGQKEELESISEKFRFEFKNLAQGILEEKTTKFTLVNEENMRAILNPLKSELLEFKKKIDDTYDKESKERFTLGKEVQRLVEMSQQVSQEANNLTTALKGNNKLQGNWGEMILESILSYSGLTKGREFVTQEFIKDNAGNIIKDEFGKGLQPDVTVIYPDQRKIIIDSKVSLIAWEQYISEQNPLSQDQFLKEHIQSIRNHIDGLSKKKYPIYAQALDYVLLFIPIEPAFLEAVKTDLQLWKYAYDKRIMLVSPTNLLAVLKIIADLWKVEQQNHHAIEIADKAGLLYDKFVGFIDNLELVGKSFGNDAQGIFLAGTFLVLLGMADDRFELDAITKLAGQALAAGILLLYGIQILWLPINGVTMLPPSVGQLLTVLIVLVTINAVNFIDGLDGLAAGIVAIAGSAFFAFAYLLAVVYGFNRAGAPSLITAIAIGVCLGFLPHNSHPARIFMGDSGSMFLGLMLAASAITLTGQVDPNAISEEKLGPALLPLLLPFAVLAIPLADLTLAIFRRIRAGKSPFSSDKHLRAHRSYLALHLPLLLLARQVRLLQMYEYVPGFQSLERVARGVRRLQTLNAHKELFRVLEFPWI